jgi:hypothetical protein
VPVPAALQKTGLLWRAAKAAAVLLPVAGALWGGGSAVFDSIAWSVRTADGLHAHLDKLDDAVKTIGAKGDGRDKSIEDIRDILARHSSDIEEMKRAEKRIEETTRDTNSQLGSLLLRLMGPTRSGNLDQDRR